MRRKPRARVAGDGEAARRKRRLGRPIVHCGLSLSPAARPGNAAPPSPGDAAEDSRAATTHRPVMSGVARRRTSRRLARVRAKSSARRERNQPQPRARLRGASTRLRSLCSAHHTRLRPLGSPHRRRDVSRASDPGARAAGAPELCACAWCGLSERRGKGSPAPTPTPTEGKGRHR